MFDAPFNWPRQNWKIDPAPFINAILRPTSVDSAAHMRRDFPMTAFVNQSNPSESEEDDSSKLTCNAVHVESPVLFESDGSLAYDHFQFEDLLGNQINGRACDVIYADDYDGRVTLLVNPDGSVQYIWGVQNADEQRKSPVTRAETHMPTAEAARPSAFLCPDLPESTSLSYDAVVSHITASPHSADIEHHLRHLYH